MVAAVDAVVVEAVVDSAVVDSVAGAVASTVDEVEDAAAVVVVDSVVGSVDSLVEDVSPGFSCNYAKVNPNLNALLLVPSCRPSKNTGANITMSENGR